jgi:hypothetical protein
MAQQRLGATGVLFDDGWGNWRFPLAQLDAFADRFGPASD